MRELEAAAIGSGSVTGLELMERAGQGVVDAILAEWPELGKSGGVVVLCGPGNNGGDGFVVARLLHELGHQVTVFFYGHANRLPSDARANYTRWITSNGSATECLSFPDVADQEARHFGKLAYEKASTAVIVDALFGIGLARPLTGLKRILKLHERYKEQTSRGASSYHVSVDVPSGLAENGPIADGPAEVFYADLTVTFHSLKDAHKNGVQFCGKTIVVDIGLPAEVT